ncbi:hypothetical protein AGR56_00355 [Clostridium sp. DMHC 10]|uniref:TetR/AcrR family transcriptional regulator n=1 Tax=Clostridium sp. DMHC 10 TaxID=747377 RepID=UPI00069EC775|nr:TetR/AcrR family transcriptional regulator [Clostridium sp. DMHC 10]KOF58246.1 hypothetical protein AGR56_00355 [Clostridium sp. DMHC 10]
MYDSFYAIDKEKQIRIINAAMKVFSESPYRKASTADIAAASGISKGSLFYYFKNKRDLYCYLYVYSWKKIYEKIDEIEALKESDFFERNAKIVEARVNTMLECPHIFDFSLRAYYETDIAVSKEIKAINERILKDAYVKLNENIDVTKFKNKEGINRAIKMLVWIGGGFIKEKMAEGKMDLKELQDEIYEYMKILKHGFYKGGVLSGEN